MGRSSLTIAAVVLMGIGAMTTVSRVAASGIPPDCGTDKAPYSFAVLAEGFTASEQGFFAAVSHQMVCGLAFEKEPLFKSHPGAFAATSVPLVSTTSATAATPDTALQITYTGSRHDDCFFKTGPDTLQRIVNGADQASDHQQVLVMVNIGDQEAGCTDGDAVFLTRGSRWQILAHEIGHVLSLKDEYTDLPGVSTETLNHSNCSLSPAWWATLKGAAYLKGCARYDNFFHAFDACRMHSEEDVFCNVCRQLIEEALPPPAQDPVPSVLLSIRLSHSDDAKGVGAGGVEVLGAKDVVSQAPRAPQVRKDAYLAVVLVGDSVAAIADESRFFADSQLIRRAYGSGAVHDVSAAREALIILHVPRFTSAQLRNRNPEFRLIRVMTADPPGIMSAAFLRSDGVQTLFQANPLTLPQAPGR